MNTRGQTIMVGMMLAITIIILTLGLAPGVREFVDDARDSSNMDCDNSSISDFDQAGCIAVDLTTFYFIGGLLFIALAVFTARKAFF